MFVKWLGLSLAMVSGVSWGQVGDLHNADVTDRTSISNPAKALGAAEGQWLAFSLPVLAGTRSPCCWKGRWNGKGEVGCALKPKHESYGTRSDSPLTDTIIVYNEIRNGQVQSLRIVGEQCPVDGNAAQVTWIGSVDDRAGLDWLEDTARSDNGDSALYALSLHHSKNAGKRLYSLAKETGSDASTEAIFWLANSDNDSSVAALTELLTQ